MPLDLDKLEVIARAATPGKREWIDHYGSVKLDIVNGDHILMAEPCGDMNSSVIVADADAALIAACDRETVLELIAAARAAPQWRTNTPPRGVRCLVTAPHPKHDGALRVFVATLSPDYDGHCWFGDGVRIHGVIAWMPAPEPAVRPEEFLGEKERVDE